MKTIFVQIASYRDPECQWTVKDLLSKAKHPERVHVGICWQYDPEHDADCFKTAEWPDQVKFNPFHWQESEGVCWARHQAQQLWDGEDYLLSIDSSMRFAKGWDEELIAELTRCPSPKAILSAEPASYTPPDQLQKDAMPTVLRAHLYTPQGDLHIKGVALSRVPKKPLRGAFCIGGYLFAKSDFIKEVPQDPFLYSDQEDISLSARAFTHGYDAYSPKSVMLYRYDRKTAPDAKHPPRHREDNPNWLKMQERGRKRLKHLLGHTPSTHPLIIEDIALYGLGSERSIADYQSYTGIDFARRTVSSRALRCEFIETLHEYADTPIRIPEIDDGTAVVEQISELDIAIKHEPHAAFDQPAAIERLMRETPNGAKLNVDKEAPEGVMIIYDYIDAKTCKMLKAYADSQAFTTLDVVDPLKSTKDKIVTQRNSGRVTHHVEIDGRAPEILNIFNDVYCQRMAAFYDVNFEWYERPQILRYPPGGKYDRHADADHWIAEKDEWVRVQDRDYSVLLYLNDEYDGGELELVTQQFTIKPKPGMLLAFPSDYRYLHAALPTTSGIRYVIVSWSAILGSKRVRPQMPYASIYVRQKRSA